MGLLEIIVVLVLAVIIGLAFYYSNKAEKMARSRADQKRKEQEPHREK